MANHPSEFKFYDMTRLELIVYYLSFTRLKLISLKSVTFIQPHTVNNGAIFVNVKQTVRDCHCVDCGALFLREKGIRNPYFFNHFLVQFQRCNFRVFELQAFVRPPLS